MAQAAAVLERNTAHRKGSAIDRGLSLSASVQEVLMGMFQIVRQESASSTDQFEVYPTATSDEIEPHLVISIQTDLPAADAFALWDRLSDAVQAWAATLPKPQEDIALGIAVEVLWSVDYAAP